jgi:predicted secreted protein
MLILPNPGSGGYMVRDPEFNCQVLTLQRMEKKPPSDASREGDFGSLEWTFRARKGGLSFLCVRAFRPWEKDGAAMAIFEASVLVSP